jgi:hypothetical protein
MENINLSHSPEFVLSLALGTFLSFLIYLRTGYLRKDSTETSTEINDLPLEKNEEEEPFLTCQSWEKRKSKRRRGAIVPVLIKDSEEKLPPIDGLVTDRSLGGLSVLVKAPMPAGTFLTLRNAKSAETMPWVKVEVKTCTQDGIDWRLGCEFLQTPPSVVLWQFD